MGQREFLDEDKRLVARLGMCDGAAVLGCLLLALPTAGAARQAPQA